MLEVPAAPLGGALTAVQHTCSAALEPAQLTGYAAQVAVRLRRLRDPVAQFGCGADLNQQRPLGLAADRVEAGGGCLQSLARGTRGLTGRALSGTCGFTRRASGGAG
ncbi:MAG TPA: hypothetical protein VIM18_05005 [Solirubrobacteraceae bacterium]|jgi:hypothetical protein